MTKMNGVEFEGLGDIRIRVEQKGKSTFYKKFINVRKLTIEEEK